VEVCEAYLEGGFPLFVVNSRRYSSSVVGDRDRAVCVDLHVDRGRPSGHYFVYAVVDHFEDHVMKTAGIGASYVHPRPFSYGLEAVQSDDAILIVHFLIFPIHNEQLRIEISMQHPSLCHPHI